MVDLSKKRLFTASLDRRLFLAGLSSAALAGCAASGSGLIPGKRLQIVCPTDVGIRPQTCNTSGGGGGAYASTGGINPGAWANFDQDYPTNPFIPQAGGYYSRGWNSTSHVAHGCNDGSGNLVYTGSSSFTNDGTNLSVTPTVSFPNGPSVSGTATQPANVPMQGSYTMALDANNSAQVTTNAAAGSVQALFAINSSPVSLTCTAEDQYTYRLDYTDLTTGDTNTFYTYISDGISTQSGGIRPASSGIRPQDLPGWACNVLEAATIILTFAALLFFLLALGPIGAAAAAEAEAMMASLGWWTFGIGAVLAIEHVVAGAFCH